VQLCRHGDFLAAQIAAHPLLLDELIDERLLSQPPTRAGFARDSNPGWNSCARRSEQQVEPCGSSSARPCFASRSGSHRRAALMQVSDRSRHRRAHRRARHAAGCGRSPRIRSADVSDGAACAR